MAAHGDRHRGACRLIAGEEADARRASRRSWPTPPTPILDPRAASCTGRFFIDDEVLREAGVTDLSRYRPDGAAAGEVELMPDFFLD